MIHLAHPVFVMLLTLAAVSAAETHSDGEPQHYPVTDYGAVGDGTTVNTRAIQTAIDACTAKGGGLVVIAGGRFVTGTLYLKDHVVLHVAEGAALLGSTSISDYATDTHKNMYRGEPHMDRCLIFARNATDIGLEGKGIIDGQGTRTTFPNSGDAQKNRPMLIRFLECSHIRVRDITLRNPASWTSAWLYCQDIDVANLTISSRVNSNGDGLDFDGCQRVRVRDSRFDTSDDSICLQTSRSDRPCRDVVISDCTFRSHWAGMRIGLLSRGDMDNVSVSRCTFTDISDSGLKIQMNEGATLRDMTFTDLTMTNVPRPVFMTLARVRACVDAPENEIPPIGSIQGITFRNLTIDARGGKDAAIILSGLPDHPIRNLTFSAIRLSTGGGGSFAQGEVRSLAAFPTAGWPEYGKLKATVPAHGFYARHIEGLALNGITLQVQQADGRPGMVFDGVADMSIADTVFAATSAPALVRLQQVRRATIGSCTLPDGNSPFLRVEGKDSTGIRISRGTIASGRGLVSRADDLDASAIVAGD